MKANVELEFINKVRELSENMQELSFFWAVNQKELEDANLRKGYPFSESFDDLALNTYNWALTLINNYCQKDQMDFFDTYYKSLQK